MKKYLLISLLLLVAIGLLPAQMIDNEGFEGDTFPPPGWINEGGVTRITPPVGNPAPVPSDLYGTYSANFTSPSQGLIAPKMANPYTLTISAYQIGNGNCAPRYHWATSLAGPWTVVETFNNLPNGRWNTQTVAVNMVNVYLRVSYKQGGSPTAVFDNITITPQDYVFTYRTVASGNWSDPNIWEYTRDGSTWYNANIPPSASGAVSITIRSGHSVAVTSNVTADQLVVESTGSLSINSGVVFTLANADGTDLVMDGTLVNSGTLAFDSGATMTAGVSSDITYNGSAAQTLGVGFPATVNNLTINNASGVNMSGSLTVNGALQMQAGTLATGSNTLTVNSSVSFSSSSVISGAGSFILSSGATLSTANAAGIQSSGATGSVQTNSRSFSSTANYVYNGSTTQVTGTGLPANVNNLTINNSSGVTLSGSTQVNGNLSLVSGLSIGSDNTLTINGTVSGSGGLTGGQYSGLSVTGSGDLYMPAISTLKQLSLNRAGTAYLGSDLVIHNTLDLYTDLALNGYTLTLLGTVPTRNGVLIAGGNSSLVVDGNGQVILPGISSTLKDLTIGADSIVTTQSVITVTNSFVNNGSIDVGTYGVTGSGSSVNNGTIISSISNPITTTTYNQAQGSVMQFDAITTLPAGFTYQNLQLNSPSTLFTLGGDITVNETFKTANSASLDLNGNRMIFPFKYVSVAGNAVVTEFDPETYVEGPGYTDSVVRKWTFTASGTNAVTIYLHWDNAQGSTVNFDNGTLIWRYNGSIWYVVSTLSGQQPVADGASRMMIGFSYDLGSKENIDGQYAVSGYEATLPVELSSFTAVPYQGSSVMLKWVTQTETNVSGFRVYRSTSDQLEYATALNTFISGTNTSQTQYYVFYDREIYEPGSYYYWLENVDYDGASAFHGPVSVVLDIPITVPVVDVLSGINKVYPNPFNPTTTINYGVKGNGLAILEIFNTKGQRIRELVSGYNKAGNHKTIWDGLADNGTPVQSGVYLLRLTADGKTHSRKILLQK